MGCGVSNEMPLVEEDAISKNLRRSKESSSSGGRFICSVSIRSSLHTRMPLKPVFRFSLSPTEQELRYAMNTTESNWLNSQFTNYPLTERTHVPSSPGPPPPHSLPCLWLFWHLITSDSELEGDTGDIERPLKPPPLNGRMKDGIYTGAQKLNNMNIM